MGCGRRPRGAGSGRRRRCLAGGRAVDLRADVRELPPSRLRRVGRPVDRRPARRAPRLLKAPPADREGAAALSKVVASARGAFGLMRAMEPLPAAPPDRIARAPSLPLSPPCGHSDVAIRLWFGRKVEVCVCVTGVSGVDLLISKE